jgi:hypothetical protein
MQELKVNFIILKHSIECGINSRSVIQRTVQNAIIEQAVIPGNSSLQAYQSQVNVLQASNPEDAAHFPPHSALRSSIGRNVVRNRPIEC